jgi:signal peptidase I
MFDWKKRKELTFGSVAAEDDKDIEVRKRPRVVSSGDFGTEARLLLRDLVFIVMGIALLLVFIVQPVEVEGTSMLPRLHDGERIFVNKLIYYGLPHITRGDIVVFWYPNDPSKSYIKRVVGLPGETVEVRGGHVIINGHEINEPYLDPQLNQSRANLPPVTVKEHYYFVMGDNRDDSSDSRRWGLVPEKYIYGKAMIRYWPPMSASLIKHETEYDNVPPPPATSMHSDDADATETDDAR